MLKEKNFATAKVIEWQCLDVQYSIFKCSVIISQMFTYKQKPRLDFNSAF